MPWARTVHGAATVTRLLKPAWPRGSAALAMPDLFAVITYFRARGDGFARIARIGFERDDEPGKPFSARGLKAWYEAEMQRRRSTGTASGKRR